MTHPAEDMGAAQTAALDRTTRELAALYEVSFDLGSTLDLDELLDSLLDAALRVVCAPVGYVVLRDRESGSLFLRSVRGVEDRDARGRRSSVAEWVAREVRPLLVNPPDGAGDFVADRVTGAVAAIGVPVNSTDGLAGVVVVGDNDSTRQFSSDDVRVLATVANYAGTALSNAEHFARVQEAYLATVRSLAAAIDAKDPYTRGHSDRVATLALLVAERLALSHEDRLALELAAYLHDIGKIGIRENVLHKPTHLDEGETAEMREHPLIGASILEPVAFPWEITPIVRHHHEHWDGSGYPDGLVGTEIPLLARIISVADSHEAMVSDRPYRNGMATQMALDELKRCAGTQFDTRIVAVFCEEVSRQSA
jgi:putative nucleotidyltransferase with HDIG domain